MTALRSYLSKSSNLAVFISILSITSLSLCMCLNGFHYETKKLKNFLTTLTLAFIYQFFLADVRLIFLRAIIYATFLHLPWTGIIDPAYVGGNNRKEYLKRRIAALKKQLKLGPTFYKRNEGMTHRYKDILNDLLLFGSYLAILLLLLIGTRDPLSFYNNRIIKDVLRNPKLSHHAISSIITVDDLYDFINGTIVQGLNDGRSYNGEPFAESGWMYQQIAKVLGVVRLRQIRHKDLNKSFNFETAPRGPGWTKEPSSLAFMDKFWRIFQPWKHQSNNRTGGLDASGKLYYQPGGGYIVLLGRNMANSLQVLDFVYKNQWIDSHTAAVIIEFTLYNVDADLFTLVRISAEQSAFNAFVMTDRIHTVKLLFNIDNLAWYVLLTILLYFLIVMEVLSYVVQKLWYSRSTKDFFSESWNYVDMGIVCLNICIGVGVVSREVYVKSLLVELETSKKNEYIPFYHAATVDETCTVLIALLVALAILRLWKILQFAVVFRVLTRTLDRAKKPLASTTFFIFVFLAGIGLGAYIINGSNSPSFADFLKSITSLLSLSFGFAASTSPSDLNHGGSVIGFLLYTLLVVGVTIFLLNMFITVLCLHFSQVKEEGDEKSKDNDSYTFWHFLVSEAAESSWLSVFKRDTNIKKSNKDDVLRLRGGGSIFGKPKDVSVNNSEHLRRMELISEILDTQMQLLMETLEKEDVEADDAEGSVHLNEVVTGESVGLNAESSELDETSKNLKISIHKNQKNRKGIAHQDVLNEIRSM